MNDLDDDLDECVSPEHQVEMAKIHVNYWRERHAGAERLAAVWEKHFREMVDNHKNVFLTGFTVGVAVAVAVAALVAIGRWMG